MTMDSHLTWFGGVRVRCPPRQQIIPCSKTARNSINLKHNDYEREILEMDAQE